MTTSSGTVLVVGDGGDTTVQALGRAGWSVAFASDGRAALRSFHQHPTDLVVLDVSVGGTLSGWDLLQRIRDLSDVPVLVLSALSDEQHKVRALELGADDYVTEPIGDAELRARARALVRRAPTSAVVDTYSDDVVTVRFDTHDAFVHGRRVDLSPLEFRLLCALVRNSQRTIPTRLLLEEVWHEDDAGSRVKFAILRLRRKLGLDEHTIVTVRGVGYRYEPPIRAPAPSPAKQ